MTQTWCPPRPQPSSSGAAMPAAISGWTMASRRKLPAANPGRERNFPVTRAPLKSGTRNDEQALDGFAEILFVSPFGLPAQHLFDHLGNAVGPRLWSTVIKNGQQMSSAMRLGHSLPFFIGLRVLAESQLHDWRQITLGFHGLRQPLCDLPRTAAAGFFVSGLGNPFGDFIPPRRIQRFKELQQPF